MKRTHGTIAKYIKESCRCVFCRLAWKIYYDNWKAKHPGYKTNWRKKNKGYIEIKEGRSKVRKNKSEKQRLKKLRRRIDGN